MKSTEGFSQEIERLKSELGRADAVLVGAGAGLSTSAGFIYSGERFQRYFSDFIEKYHFRDMYSGGFYPFETPEEQWAYWSRYIYINRYMDPPEPVYDNLFELVKNKDYFVLTTNVDHCFQKAGFDKNRLFYTQGDFGLFQCSEPCHDKSYDNEKVVRQMILAQGFRIEGNSGEMDAANSGENGVGNGGENGTENSSERDTSHGELIALPDVPLKMRVPSELVPYCPVCGKPMSMNLRADDTFVQDEGWYQAKDRYYDFARKHENSHILYLELGVGMNTPVIIKYPFWQATANNKNAVYACINYGEAYCPEEIEERAICINSDIGSVLEKMV